MKHLARGLALFPLLGLITPASAADLGPRTYVKAVPPQPIYDWSGFYLGADAGWASAHSCWNFVGVPGVPLPVVNEGCHDGSGAIAGGHIGYHIQTGPYVFGVEAQGNWTDLKGSNNPAAFPGTTNRTAIDAIGLFTGHVGYAWNNTLLYLKGGAAVVHDRFDFRFTGSATPLATTTDTRWGGAVGAGFEYGFLPNWSVGAEYNHVFLGRRDETFGPSALSAAGVVENIKQDVDIVTARVSYRFGAPIVAKY